MFLAELLSIRSEEARDWPIVLRLSERAIGLASRAARFESQRRPPFSSFLCMGT
jgi:hypothetical protein